MRRSFGTQCSRRAKSSASSRAGSARATRCDSKCVIRSTVPILSPERNPIEAGLGFFVDLTKPNFIGRDVLLKTKENGPREKLVPFRMKDKGPPPRPHYSVFENGERIGEVTSGTLSPSLNWGVGMAYVSCVAREDRREDRDRNSRTEISRPPSRRNRSTKNHECSRRFALHRELTNGLSAKATTSASASPITRNLELTDVVFTSSCRKWIGKRTRKKRSRWSNQ